jgi:hypothetical protein
VSPPPPPSSSSSFLFLFISVMLQNNECKLPMWKLVEPPKILIATLVSGQGRDYSGIVKIISGKKTAAFKF